MMPGSEGDGSWRKRRRRAVAGGETGARGGITDAGVGGGARRGVAKAAGGEGG